MGNMQFASPDLLPSLEHAGAISLNTTEPVSPLSLQDSPSGSSVVSDDSGLDHSKPRRMLDMRKV
jgi:hypothetical protein